MKNLAFFEKIQKAIPVDIKNKVQDIKNVHHLSSIEAFFLIGRKCFIFPNAKMKCSFKNILHTLLVLIFHILSLRIGFSYIFTGGHIFVGLTKILIVFCSIIYGINMIVIIGFAWFRAVQIEAFCNDYSIISSALQKFGVQIASRRRVLVVTTLFCIFGFLATLAEIYSYIPKINLLGGLYSMGSIYLPEIYGKNQTRLKELALGNGTEITFGEKIGGVCFIFWHIYGSLIGRMLDLFCMAYVMSLSSIIGSVTTWIEDALKCGQLQSVPVACVFDPVYKLSKLVNRAQSVQMAAVLVYNIPQIMFCILRMESIDLASITSLIFIFSMYAAILIGAAGANSKMKIFEDWIYERRRKRPISDETEEEDAVLHLISENAVGIKGLSFTITYSFIGNVFGLIITNAAIIYQISGQKNLP